MTNPVGELNEVSETRMALPRLNDDTIYRPFFIAGIATVLSLGGVHPPGGLVWPHGPD